MTKKKNIYDLGEEKLMFINEFLIDMCLQIDPNLDVKKLSQTKQLLAIEVQESQFQYFFNGKIPLLFLDLNLLIDGV